MKTLIKVNGWHKSCSPTLHACVEVPLIYVGRMSVAKPHIIGLNFEDSCIKVKPMEHLMCCLNVVWIWKLPPDFLYLALSPNTVGITFF